MEPGQGRTASRAERDPSARSTEARGQYLDMDGIGSSLQTRSPLCFSLTAAGFCGQRTRSGSVFCSLVATLRHDAASAIFRSDLYPALRFNDTV